MTRTITPPAEPELPADLAAGLRRLKLAAMRRIAPELLITAQAQRWKPEDLLRTLVDAEIAARDASNAATRAADRRVPGHQDAQRARPGRVHPRRRQPRLPRVPRLAPHPRQRVPRRPARHRQEPPLIALGHAAVEAGHRVRYFTAAELVDTLYRALADNSVGRTIDSILRADYVIVDELGFAPLDDTGSQLLFRFVAAAYEHRSLGTASHWPFDQWGRFLPEHTTATALLDRLLHHGHVLVTEGDSYRMREARTRTTRTTRTRRPAG